MTTPSEKPLAYNQPAPTLQDLSNVDQYLVERIRNLRLEYAQLTCDINAALASGEVKWSGKRSLRLSMPELTKHMQRRHDRLKCLHHLLLLVPMHRLALASLQQHKTPKVTTFRQLPAVTQMLSMRCGCALPHAKDEVAYLATTYPSVFGPYVIETARNEGARAKQAKAANERAQKARALHSKLLASGLLDASELELLRNVFSQYHP